MLNLSSIAEEVLGGNPKPSLSSLAEEVLAGGDTPEVSTPEPVRLQGGGTKELGMPGPPKPPRVIAPALQPGEQGMSALEKPGFTDRIKGVFTGDVWSGDTLPSRILSPKPSDSTLAALDKTATPIQQTPLVRPEALSPERGPQRAVLQFAGGLTTPENAAIVAAMGKLNKIPEVGAALARTASGGFSMQMLTGALSEDPEWSEARQRGDKAVMSEIAVRKGLEFLLGGAAGKHAAGGKAPVIERPARPRARYESLSQPVAPSRTPPKMELPELLERKAGVQVEPAEAPAGPDWWKEQAPTRPEVEAEYAGLFDQAERRNQRAQERAARQPVEIPEVGPPEGVQRGVDARERIARQVAGKPWEELTNSERIAVDDLIAEGYTGAGEIPSPEPVEAVAPKPVAPKPAPKPPAAEWRVVDEKPLAPIAEEVMAEPKPYALSPEEQAALRRENAPTERVEPEASRVAETGAAEPIAAPQPEVARAVEPRPEIAPLPSEKEVIQPSQPKTEGAVNPAPPAGQPESPRVAPPESSLSQEGGAGKAIVATAGERGSFSLKPTGPQTPTERYAKEQVAKREAARKGPMADLTTRLKEVTAKAKTEVVDATAPILDTINAWQKEHGELPEARKIDNQIDRVYRSRSMADQFMEDHGLIDTIQKVEDIDYLDQYVIAKHAQTVERLKQTADKSMTPRDLVKDADLIDEFRDRIAIPATKDAPAKTYEQVAQEITGYSRKILDYAVDSGLISKDLATALKQMYPEYVPLNRVFNAVESGELGGNGMGGRGVASLSAQTVVQRLMGSEREIENPFASLIDKTYRAFGQGERNKASGILANYRELPGMDKLIVEDANAPANLSFHWLDEGKKRTFRTTPEIAAAAKSLDSYQIGVVGQVLAAPARVAKWGITGINPVFMVRNIASDVLFTSVTSKYSRTLANPMVFTRAFMGAVKHDAAWAELVREGGGFTSFDVMRNKPKQTIDKIRAGRGAKERMDYLVEHPVSSLADLFRAAEDVVSKSEEAGRLRLYLAAKARELKAGRSEADARSIAVREANNALPNYSRGGNLTRALNGTIIYLNAGVQGTRSFVNAMQRRPVETSAKVALSLYTPVALATLWNLSGPDRKRAYADIKEYERDGNIILLKPGKQSQDGQKRYEVIKVKLPPGLNKLTIPVRRAMEAWAGMDPVKFGEVAGSLVGSVVPMDNFSDVVPQALKPGAQYAANYDFFRRQPKVPRRLQDQPAELQVQPYTSGTARKVAGVFGASPIKVEELVKDTLGGDTASGILRASDRALYAAGKIPKEQIGGTGTAEAMGAALFRARGGELENREYEKRSELEQAAIKNAIEREKRSATYLRLATEELRQKRLQAIANRARTQVTRITSTARYKALPPERKMAELKRLEPRIKRTVPAWVFHGPE